MPFKVTKPRFGPVLSSSTADSDQFSRNSNVSCGPEDALLRSLHFRKAKTDWWEAHGTAPEAAKNRQDEWFTRSWRQDKNEERWETGRMSAPAGLDSYPGAQTRA